MPAPTSSPQEIVSSETFETAAAATTCENFSSHFFFLFSFRPVENSYFFFVLSEVGVLFGFVFFFFFPSLPFVVFLLVE